MKRSVSIIASTTSQTFRPRNGMTRGSMPALGSVRCGITVPQALPAPLDGVDTVRPSRCATRPSALMLWIPLLFALLLMLPPMQGYAYWTSSTSEEYPPIGCQPGDLISGVSCAGSNCDNLALNCAETNYAPAVRSWRPFISEESPNTQICPSVGFMTGLACQGRYCDNIAVECSIMYGHARSGTCHWTGAISEEGGVLSFSTSYYAAGVACSGNYCDNVSFYVCRVD
jgi:hypothetical protein